MSFPMEDFERARELDQMYLAEKQQEMFVEWQQWEEEQAEKDRKPAEIVVLTEIPHEAEPDCLPF